MKFDGTSSNDLMNRKKLTKNSSDKAASLDQEMMIALKKKRKGEIGHDNLGKKLCDQSIPIAVSYASWKDTNEFSDAFDATMKANNADQKVRAAQVDIYGKSGLTESHINSINSMSATLGEKKLISAFVKSGKNIMNKKVTMNILAQAKLYVASLMTDNDDKKDGDRRGEDEQDLSFINNANKFLTTLFSLDSVIEVKDLPPLFFCKAIFEAFRLDTPVCNEFDLPTLYESNEDEAHRVLLWRLFQAEALYAVFSRFALTLSKGVGYSAELVEVIDVAASSYRVYYRYYYCGGCWYWASYAVTIPEVKHVEFQGKDAPGLRVIMNSLLLNVNTQAQTLLDYDSVVENQLILMKDTVQAFMDSNFEKEVKLIFKSMDKLFNTAKKMGLLMDDIAAVSLELEHCIGQINSINYSNVYQVLANHRNNVKDFHNKREIRKEDFKINGSSMFDSIYLFAGKVSTMYEATFETAYFGAFNAKAHILEYNKNDVKFIDDLKHAGKGLKVFFGKEKDLRTVFREAGLSSILGFMLGKIVDLTTRGRVSADDIVKSQENNTAKEAKYNSMILSLRDSLYRNNNENNNKGGKPNG